MDDSRTSAAAVIPLHLVLEATGATVVLDRTGMVLGRHSQADVRLPLPDVSRRHCRFDFDGGSWHVTDLDSLNGVFVNDSKVVTAPLTERDRLRLGGFTFAVHLGHDVPTLILPHAAVTAHETLRDIAGSLSFPRGTGPLRRAS